MMERYLIRFTKEQKEILKKKAETSGFSTISEYIRFVLFMEDSIEKKIEEIHRRICKDASED
jgi:hypothetical protein